MISCFTILLLQFAFIYKLPFIPKSFRLHCQDEKRIEENEMPKMKNITKADITKFIENIKKKNQPEFIEIESWDDGEVEW